MRLTEEQRSIIKATVESVIGTESQVWLFGSRVDDSKRGGDIDLLVETKRVLSARVPTLCKLEGALIMRLGDRKFDILLKDGRTNDLSVFKVAREKGILL